MVEYVLSNSPTNKDSTLSLEPRLRELKFDKNDKVCISFSVQIGAFADLIRKLFLSHSRTMIKRNLTHHSIVMVSKKKIKEITEMV